MRNACDDVIINVRRKVIKDMIIPKSDTFNIRKDLKAGKLVISKKKKFK